MLHCTNGVSMLARKFLYAVAILIVLTIGSAFAYRMWGQQMIAAVMVPSAPFRAPAPISDEEYAERKFWLARPDITAGNKALWQPKGAWQPAVPGKAAIFYVHPTSYLAPFNSARWNAKLDDAESLALANRYLKSQASALTAAGDIWAPKYHQAHFGAFLQKSDNRDRAIDAAYQDIDSAFTAFLRANPDGPIILAGHSQGSLLLMRLMQHRVAGKPLARRIVAAYLPGWPISLTNDLPEMGLPACTTPDQSGCILSWQSFAEPADTSSVTQAYDSFVGLNGKSRKGDRVLCINPLTGAPNSAAEEKSNLGTLAPEMDPTKLSKLVKGAVSARCGTKEGERDFLLVGNPPELGPFTLPGNNYHVYDYALFWANIRLDAYKRLTSYLSR
jgi:Protein of unknown function (DUF3089)